MVHHVVAGSSTPKGKAPLFHQMYKYDVNEATKYQVKNAVTGDTVRKNIVRNILMLLEETNYLVKQYKTANDIIADMVKCKKPLRNLFVVLRAPSEVDYHKSHHPGTLGLSQQQVQSFLYTLQDDGGPAKHGVYIVHRRFGGRLEILGYWNPLQDPLSYPMLFPYGNSGYKRKDYELKKDHVVNHDEEERMQKEREEFDPFPFEGCDDEMDTNKDCIDYDRARKKHKEYRASNGEDVSDSEDEEEDTEDEDEMETDEPDVEANVDENYDDEDDEDDNVVEGDDSGMNTFNVSDGEDDDPGREQHRFLRFGENDSDDEGGHESGKPSDEEVNGFVRLDKPDLDQGK